MANDTQSVAYEATVVGDSVPTGQVVDGETQLKKGDRIGRFEILRKLGAGGMGVVLAAHDPTLDRTVAIKILHVSIPELETRLHREAQAMAKLSHPNVVTVYEVGTWEGRVYLAMEYVEGATLGTFLNKSAANSRGGHWRGVVRAFIEAGRGLAAAHDVGLVHRDFKPDNVLVGADGRARVTDFGLVSSASPMPVADVADMDNPDSLRLTQAGLVMGTPLYMAPEQHLGDETTPQTDQFSFCVALYEHLYGEVPFRARTMEELSAECLASNIEPPATSRVPGWIGAVLRRGLRIDPAERFPSMAALLEKLNVGDDLNRSLGTSSRYRMAWANGGLWTVGAVAAGVFHEAYQQSYLPVFAWVLCIFAVSMVFATVARRRLSQTLFNRRFLRSLMFLSVAQIVVATGAYLVGLSPDIVATQLMLLHFSMAGMAAIWMESRLFAMPIAYGAAFLLSSRWPASWAWFLAAANAVLTLNAAWVWRPHRRRRSE